MRRRSFADYLVSLFLDDVLLLRSIVCCSVEGLRALETLDHPVAKAWREDNSYDTQGWAQRLATAAGCSTTMVYDLQKEWLQTYQVNIGIPRAYYRDFRLYSAVSLLQPEEREAYHNAREHGDGAKRLQVLDQADENFFEQMRRFVGGPVTTPPVPLPAKLMGDIVIPPRQRKTNSLFSAICEDDEAARQRIDSRLHFSSGRLLPQDHHQGAEERTAQRR